MKNNIAIQVGANSEPFYQQITEHFDNNISSNLCPFPVRHTVNIYNA